VRNLEMRYNGHLVATNPFVRHLQRSSPKRLINFERKMILLLTLMMRKYIVAKCSLSTV